METHYHDCSLAEVIFQQLSPDIVKRLRSDIYKPFIKYQTNPDDSVTIVIDIRKKQKFQTEKLVTHEQPPPLPPRNKPLEERLSIPQKMAKIAPNHNFKDVNKAGKAATKK